MTNPNPAAPRLYEADPTGLYAALRPFLQPDGSGYVVPFEAVASIGLSLAASRAAVLVALQGADQYDRAELAEVVAAIRSVLSVTPDTAEGAGMHRMGEYVIDKIAALQGARLRAALASGTGEPGLPCPYCQNIDGHSFDCPRPRATSTPAGTDEKQRLVSEHNTLGTKGHDSGPWNECRKCATQPSRLRDIVKRTASMGSCSQTHHEHLAREARAALQGADR
jgi:hypothetical protein